MAGSHPYLSVVATARNDNHGGDLLHRMQVFVNGLAGQCDRHGLDAELVLVEWNPPADRPRLADALVWPDDSSRLTVRIVEVPRERHARLAHAERLPLFQMIAKNVGIRRSHAPFVLATNVDVLFDDVLMAQLARRTLRPGVLYRADRFDTDAPLDPFAPVETQLRDSARNLIRICRLEGTYNVRTGEYFQIYGPLTDLPGPLARWGRLVAFGTPLALGATRGVARRGRAALATRLRSVGPLVQDSMSYGRRVTARVTRETDAQSLLQARKLVRTREGRAHMLGVITSILEADALSRRLHGYRTGAEGRPAAHSVLSAVAGQARALVRALAEYNALLAELWLHEKARVRVHSNACGDFTLLARRDWERLGGYAEFEMFSMHLDSLLLYEAHYSGLRHEVLPGAVYHLEHGGGFKPEPEGLRSLNDRVEAAAIPQITNEQFMEWLLEMYEQRKPMRPNGLSPDFGFAGERLPELRPTGETRRLREVAP